VASGLRQWASGRQAATDFKLHDLTRFFINLQSSSPDGVALAFRWLLAIFTVRSLQFAVQTPVLTGALEFWCPPGCPDICANMSPLWLVTAKVFGHFFKH
jgi:hypothetical protein